MSRKTKKLTVETDGGPLHVEVHEIRPKDVYNFARRTREGGQTETNEFGELLGCCTNLTMEQITDLYPSEMEQVIKAFKEVNASFLAPWPTLKSVIEKLGLVNWIAQVLEESGIKEKIASTFLDDWKRLVQGSSKEDT